MISDANVLDFARKCASLYCNRRNAWLSYDDALQDACLYLLEHRDRWADPEKVLKIRVVGELVRKYQNEHGLRLKNIPRFTSLEYEDAKFAQSSDHFLDVAKMRNIAGRATLQPELAPVSPILHLLLEGKGKEAREKYNLSRSTLSKIKRSFLIVCLRILNQDEGERREITEKDRQAMPLFFQ